VHLGFDKVVGAFAEILNTNARTVVDLHQQANELFVLTRDGSNELEEVAKFAAAENVPVQSNFFASIDSSAQNWPSFQIPAGIIDSTNKMILEAAEASMLLLEYSGEQR